MNIRADTWHVSDGKSQAGRRLPPLAGDYFLPNEMGFEQLLAQAAEYARLVQFYQLDLQSDGDWQGFFLADEVILLATMLVLDVRQLDAGFEQRLQQGWRAADWLAEDRAFDIRTFGSTTLGSPLLLARLFDYWLGMLAHAPGHAGREVRQLLVGILRGLDGELHLLRRSISRIEPGLDAHTLFSGGLLSLSSPGSAQAVLANAMPDPGMVGLRANFHAFLQGLTMLQQGARQLLPDSLSSGQHDAAHGLLIAFLQLFKKVQVRLNRFSEAHPDFYYQDVLQNRPRPGQPDSAFLVLRLNPGIARVEVPQGCQFIAAGPKGEPDLVYCASRDTVLNDARVARAYTLFFQGAAGGGPTCAGWVDQIHVDPNTDPEKIPPLPLFGAAKPGNEARSAHAARFGFVFAAKVLLLREGVRRIRLQMQFCNPPQRQLQHVVQALFPDQKDLNDTFIKLFRSMFRISVTVQDGWHRVAEYRPSWQGLEPEVPPDCLVLEFVLLADVPALCPYQASVHGDAMDSSLPMVRLEMLQNEYYYPYDLLKQWILQEVRIEVDVTGCRQLLLHNQIGQLSAQAPFMPFGPLPQVGAYFLFGHEELLSKQLKDLTIEIEWAGLPLESGGFPAYYHGYAKPLNAGQVSVAAAVLADGQWLVAEADNRQQNLFAWARRPDGSATNQVALRNRLSFREVVRFYKPLAQGSNGEFGWTPSTLSGLFKLTLTDPEGAFGHQEYPTLLSQTLTFNSRQKNELLMRPLPKAPWTPQISRIVLNYQAVSLINFEHGAASVALPWQEKMFHLHPFGVETLHGASYRAITLLPDYEAPGNLLIGLDAPQLSGPLTLYFYLREDSLPIENIEACRLRWWYLSDNRWKSLPQARIMQDETANFMVSGIVSLDLPDDLARQHTAMPDGYFWLRISGDKELDHFCSAYSIFAQAIRVDWQGGVLDRAGAALAAKSINRAKTSLSGVSQVLQVRKSFGGQGAENMAQFRTRVAERLRHKNRAITPFDYESLILERFPEIYKVKCFANLCLDNDPAARLKPGHILIIAIPFLTPGGHVNQKPYLSGHLIGEVRQFIASLTPPWASVAVENPVYEEIQVRAHVTLRADLRGGWYNNQINEALCNFLSPWQSGGYQRHFGWCIRQHDLVSFLLDQDYIDAVTGFSMVRVVPALPNPNDPDSRKYTLQDNAKAGHKDIYPFYPWSIAVPMNHHYINIMDRFEHLPPTAVGVDKLEIGSTFIIPPRNPS